MQLLKWALENIFDESVESIECKYLISKDLGEDEQDRLEEAKKKMSKIVKETIKREKERTNEAMEAMDTYLKKKLAEKEMEMEEARSINNDLLKKVANCKCKKD